MINFNQPELIFYAPADVAKLYQGLKDIGADRIRLEADWQLIETAPGTFDWRALDAAVNPAASYGIRPLIVASCGMHAPTWATPASFGSFCGDLARRYTADFEIGNEPNLASFWNPISAATYVTYLKAGYPAIKAAQPTATVLCAGIASTPSWLNLTEDSEQFLTDMYAAGAHGFMDAVAFHPYSANAGTGAPLEPTPTEAALVYLNKLHAVMIANGDALLDIWCTEFGFGTSADVHGVTPDVQASWLIEEATNLLALPFVAELFIYDDRDSAADEKTNFNDSLGVLNNDWSRKPAWAAIQAFNAQNGFLMALTDAQQLQLLNTVIALAQAVAALQVTVHDVQIQLRGPNLKGWSQLGQNAAGEDLTMVDNLGEATTTLKAIAKKIGA